MDTSRYTALKLGRRSETGKEKGVTPEFGEQKEEKILPPKSGRYTCLAYKALDSKNWKEKEGQAKQTRATKEHKRSSHKS
jgi:hypothetical protein